MKFFSTFIFAFVLFNVLEQHSTKYLLVEVVGKAFEVPPIKNNCPPGFQELDTKLPDVMRANYSTYVGNYEFAECTEICKKSSGCHSYLYSAEENGCYVFRKPKGMKVPGRTGPKVDPNGEVACEKIDGGNEIVS